VWLLKAIFYRQHGVHELVFQCAPPAYLGGSPPFESKDALDRFFCGRRVPFFPLDRFCSSESPFCCISPSFKGALARTFAFSLLSPVVFEFLDSPSSPGFERLAGGRSSDSPPLV